MHQDVNLFDKDIAVTILPSSQYGPIPIPNISISLNEYYSGKVLGNIFEIKGYYHHCQHLYFIKHYQDHYFHN